MISILEASFLCVHSFFFGDLDPERIHPYVCTARLLSDFNLGIFHLCYHDDFFSVSKKEVVLEVDDMCFLGLTWKDCSETTGRVSWQSRGRFLKILIQQCFVVAGA